jgi:N-acetylneuraminate synthase
MILDRELHHYIIHRDATVGDAIAKVTAQRGRILFGVDHHHHLEGALTNGDLMRWLADHGNGEADLSTPVIDILKRNCRKVTDRDPEEKIHRLLEDFLFVPVIDQRGHLVAVARRRSGKDEVLTIAGRRISTNDPAFVIAEIGNNHNGSMDRARRLIDAAVEAGADCAKFQMRDMESLYHNQGEVNDDRENLGSQYTLDLLSRFQLAPEQLFECFDYCRKREIIPLCTPWDPVSVDMLEDYGMPAYKLASADLTNHDLIRRLIDTGKPLILSTGMSRESEIRQTVSILRQRGASYALLHCNSAYPPPYRDIQLRYLDRLTEIGQTVTGYSGHERDIFVAVAAVARGARIIEKHLTDDRELEGNDHKISLLPRELARMVEGIRQVDESLGKEHLRDMSQGEVMNRVTLAKSVYVNRAIDRGTRIEEYMLSVKSPGHGLQPNRKSELIGRTVTRDMQAGDVFYEADLQEHASTAPRNYLVNRRWGLPVRYHDHQKLSAASNPDFLEFHLSYKDLEADIDDYFSSQLDMDLIVHSPELFAGDHTLDLCSADETWRQHSIGELQRVIEVTRKLADWFRPAGNTGIVTNVGGFTESAPLSAREREESMERLLDSLGRLDTDRVEIWPQTMPPYPWHFGGQRIHNLFVDADEIEEFCRLHGYRICLDISHSALACNHRGHSLLEFVERVGMHVAHLHIADAGGLDGEGLQIGEGAVDFVSIMRALDREAPNASFIPEIWQGHENGGQGFWLAMDKLEQCCAGNVDNGHVRAGSGG